MLRYLSETGVLPVGQIAERVGLGQSALSQHLAKLCTQGLMATRKDAQAVFHRIDQPKVLALLSVLHNLNCPALGVADFKGTEND